MSDQKENIEKIFGEALQSYEVPVGAEVWISIQASLSGVGSVSSAAASGNFFLGKAAAIIGFTGLITAATIAEVEYQNSKTASITKMEVLEERKINTKETNTFFEEERAVVEGVIQQNSVDQNTDALIGVVNDIRSEKAKASDKLGNKGVLESTLDNPTEEDNTLFGHSESTVKQSERRVETSEEVKSDVQNGSNVSLIVANNQEEKVKAEVEPEIVKTTAYFTHNAEQVITPNGDPYNEYFEVDGHGIKYFTLRIMTRGGQLVFESNDISVRWNGLDRFGNALPSGIYFYEIQAVGDDNLPYLEKNAKGNVIIVRN
tara:strand:+ start:653 stop:1603 length:951 start_codon:yes stop_codon:yes gene_type:complete